MHTVSDSKCMEMQLLNQNEGVRAYFIEVIKHSIRFWIILGNWKWEGKCPTGLMHSERLDFLTSVDTAAEA